MSIVFSVIHLLILLFLSIRYYHIVRYPEKFVEIPGFDDYKNSEWYWDRHRPAEYAWDHPNACPYRVVCVIWSILNIIAYYRINEFIINKHYAAEDAVYIFGKPSLLTFVPLLCCVLWVVYITALLPFPETISQCLVRFSFLGFNASKGYPWKKLTTWLIILTMLSWPACIAEGYNVGYVTETKLVYPEWYLKKEIEFDQIKKIYIFQEKTEQSERWTGYIYDNQTNRFDIRKFSAEDEGRIELVKYIIDHVPSDTEVLFK